MTFSEKLKNARLAKKLTQLQLAEQVGISKNIVSAYERGVKVPGRKTMLKLAKVLEVSTRFLSDDSCTDPVFEIGKDTYIEEAQMRYGASGARDMDELLRDSTALFAGGELSQEEKDKFFQAIMTAYVTCREEAKKRYGKKSEPR